MIKKINQKLNQKGQTLLAALILSMVFIAGYSGFQIYFSTLLKVQTQYREALNLMDAVDKASRDIRGGWDKAAIDAYINAGNPTSPPYPSPDTINTLFKGNLVKYLPSLDPSCSTACVGANCCPATAALCYSNPTNSSSPYCFFNSNFTNVASPLASLDFRLALPEKKEGPIERYSVKTVEMIAHLVHIFRGQGLIENKSMALPTTIEPRTDNLAPFPTVLGGATFITCGLVNVATNPNVPVCATIYACPSSFPQCSKFNGAPSPAGAIFVQQFTLTPSGGP